MTEVIVDVLPVTTPDAIAVLTGPNLAREVAEGQPTASVIACARPRTPRAQLQQLFMTATFRVYTNPDVVGCEIAGALKNVIAIAAGTAAGLGYGDNTKAALITRGLAELARLGVALGGDPLTFAGLAGMGDLVATCTSDEEPQPQRRASSSGGVARSTRSSREIERWWPRACRAPRRCSSSRRGHGVEMPIAEQVGAVLYEGRRAGRDRARAHAARGQARAPRDLVTGAGSDPLGRGTSIGVLGGARDATVDAAGALAAAGAGWALDWWIGADDRWRVPRREAGGAPARWSTACRWSRPSMRVPGGDAVQRVYGIAVADVGEVVVVEIENESPAPFVVAFAVRGASAVDLGDATAVADGRSAVRTSRPPSRLGAGRGRRAPRRSSPSGAARDRTVRPAP